ncbi:MAG: DUF2383 domain-containing protein [Myxococcales bacterium]|nr:DUF2383 domain-containing protein [Myxococcales bacterium]
MENLRSQYRGELAAIETYEQALKKYENQPEEPALQRMLVEHRDAARRLGEALLDNGEPLPRGSGVWGTVTTTVEKVATMVNDKIPLELLRRGESMGVEGYDRLLADDTLPDALFVELAALRSRCRRHISALDVMIERVPQIQSRPML